MTTSRKQITTYLPHDLVQALEKWQHSRGITSVSAAVVLILQDYLQGRSTLPGTADGVETAVARLGEELDQLKSQFNAMALALDQAGIWSSVSVDRGDLSAMPEPVPDILASESSTLHPHFQPGDWVRYYFRGRNLIEQVLEVHPTERGIDQLLLPSGQMGVEGPELDLFPATMVTPYVQEVGSGPAGFLPQE